MSQPEDLSSILLKLLTQNLTDAHYQRVVRCIIRALWFIICIASIIIGIVALFGAHQLLWNLCKGERLLANLDGLNDFITITNSTVQAIAGIVTVFAFVATIVALLITARQLSIAAAQLEELQRQSRLTSLNLNLASLRAKMETLRRGHAIPFPEQDFSEELWSTVAQSFIDDVPREHRKLATQLSERYKSLLSQRDSEEKAAPASATSTPTSAAEDTPATTSDPTAAARTS